MRRQFSALLGIVVAVVLTILPATGDNLKGYLWQNRLLLVFSPTESDPRFLAFKRSLSKGSLDIEDRDLIVLRVFETAPSSVGGQSQVPVETEELRRRFEVRRGQFKVILIGKDGGVKMVREGRVELKEIFDQIDSMPMRQREMREKRK